MNIWAETASGIGILTIPLGTAPNTAFLNTYTGQCVVRNGANPWNNFPASTWTTVDVSDLVPSDTVGIELWTFMIITNNSTQNLTYTLAHRPHGDPTSANIWYDEITCAPISQGVRNAETIKINLVGLKFDLMWTPNVTLGTSDPSSYGLNQRIMGYYR